MQAFILANNDLIHAGEVVKRWTPGSSITVCDGVNCITLFYLSDSVLWLPKPNKPSVPDPKVYKNSQPISQLTTTTGQKIAISVIGPVPTATSRYTIIIASPSQVGVLPIPAMPDPTPAPRVGKVTVGPMVIVGTPSDFTPATEQGLNETIFPIAPEDAPVSSQGGTVVCGYNGCRTVNDY
jgi:hypothetical protein